MRDNTNFGLRLLGIPELAPVDVERLERLQHKIEKGRAVFISYSRSDSTVASDVEARLSNRNISSSRDIAFLQPGQDWKVTLEKEAMGCDCFVALVSHNSGKYEWVSREISWAISEYNSRGLVEAIVPVVFNADVWEEFPELHRFERWLYPRTDERKKSFDKLADGIAAVSGR